MSALWFDATCRVKESGNVLPQSKSDVMPSHSQKAATCRRTPYQKSSGTVRRSVLKLFTVATSAGEALRANHAAEHHL